MASQGRKFLAVVGLSFVACAVPAYADVPQAAAEKTFVDANGVEFFEKRIRPVLVQHCYECHSPSAKSLKGGLLLDSRDALLKGGDSGAALVAGNADGSLLIEAIRYEGLEMPPKGQLPAGVIGDFEKWIEMGAPDPRDLSGDPAEKPIAKKQINFDEARQFWAYQSPRPARVPEVKQADWPRDEIDHFILAHLETKGLQPVRDADRWTLLRRATFDLTGLPPTIEEIESFVNDSTPNAFEKVVDRLLSSPQFGERWGRHWLDVARYAESTGKERNFTFPHAWRYRDYVIDSFNSDKPYDRFITEQVAGDLLASETVEQRNEQLIATGFLALGPKSLNERNKEQYLLDVVDEQIDVTCRAVLATTVGCARCHDHKFDPIPTTDYYAMAGIFRSTDVLAGVGERRGQEYSGPLQQLELTENTEAVDESPSTISNDDRVKQLEAELEEIRYSAKKLKAKGKSKQARATYADRVQEIQQQLRELRGSEPGAKTPRSKRASSNADVAIAVNDSAAPADCRVRIRGEVNDVGPEVPRGFVTVLTTASAPAINREQSGRLELAAWLTSRDNPLTARVLVNRVWFHLFGAGLVDTVDNFGALGERPSHPELLDYLAIRFMDQGWSVKQIIRAVMLSRTYQLSSEHNPAGYAADPANRLLWRMSRRRLDAEAIRDATLAVSGQLDAARPYASIVTELGFGEYGRRLRSDALSREVTYRSVYLPVLRGGVPEMLNVFDIADPNLVVGQRDVTTVATQALYMLNSPFVMQQADHAARRLLAEATDDAARADLAYRLTLGRPATDVERERAIDYVSEYAAALDSNSQLNETARMGAWASLCQALLASAEFRYLY